MKALFRRSFPFNSKMKLQGQMMKLSIFLFVSLALFLPVNGAYAAAAGGVDISIDGKSVAGYVETFPDGPIDPSLAKPLMDALKGSSLTFERDYKLKVDPADAAKATLRGKIKVSATFRGRDLSTAKSGHLHLVKRDGKWFVTAKEVDRLMIAAGLKKPPQKATK